MHFRFAERILEFEIDKIFFTNCVKDRGCKGWIIERYVHERKFKSTRSVNNACLCASETENSLFSHQRLKEESALATCKDTAILHGSAGVPTNFAFDADPFFRSVEGHFGLSEHDKFSFVGQGKTKHFVEDPINVDVTVMLLQLAKNCFQVVLQL